MDTFGGRERDWGTYRGCSEPRVTDEVATLCVKA
jgi:hypothetical protein